MAFIEKHQADQELAEFVLPFAKAFSRLQQVTLHVAQAGLKNPDEAGAASVDYLRLFALVACSPICGSRWARSRSESSADGTNGDALLLRSQDCRTARFFMTKILPENSALFAKIMAGAEPLMAFEDDAF